MIFGIHLRAWASREVMPCLPVIGVLLGHTDVKTTARYAHLADDPVKAAANRIAGAVYAAMNGNVDASSVPIAMERHVARQPRGR